LGWSFQVGRLFGIPLRMHITFPLLLVFVAAQSASAGANLQAGVMSALFVLALFGCVVLHELGHSLVARRYGVKVTHIMLLPIGGVAMMERIPDNPRQEFHIAIAGPLVSLGIAAVVAAVLFATGQAQHLRFQLMSQGAFFADLASINVFLALFNLIPAFPMDGGRILRSLLARRIDYARATRIAATIGQTVAILLAVFGIMSPPPSPFLVLIAVFVYLGAGQEEQQVQVRHVLRNVPVGAAMATQFATMQPDEPLSRAVQEAMAGYQHDFPVVEGGRLVGIVTRDALIAELYEHGGQTPVREVMLAEFCRAEQTDTLADLYDRLNRDGCPAVVVVQDEMPIGLLTPERVVQYLRYMARHPYESA
jgi:Zn-dependent protease/predicted transcriptional regulator